MSNDITATELHELLDGVQYSAEHFASRVTMLGEAICAAIQPISQQILEALEPYIPYFSDATYKNAKDEIVK